MALHLVPGLDLDERRLGHLAQALDEPMAARVEDTAARRVGRARDLALEADAGRRLAVDGRDGRQECLGVRVVRSAEDGLGVADLHDPSEVHDRDPVGQVAHDAQIVRDEQVARLALGLELRQEVEDRGLDGDVERARGLVGDDDARIAGERPGDRHALLQPTRELARLEVEVALGEAQVRRRACRPGRPRPCP